LELHIKDSLGIKLATESNSFTVLYAYANSNLDMMTTGRSKVVIIDYDGNFNYCLYGDSLVKIIGGKGEKITN
jgi:hypothetical protein